MQSKQNIITINENGLTLNTGLSSRQFANAKMGQYVTEPGIIVSIQNGEISTAEFRFLDTQTIPNGKADTVVLSNNSVKGKTLLEIIDDNNTVTSLKTLENLYTIIEWSFSQNIELPNCGPLGTIVTENGILFLPFELFERSILSQTKETTSVLYGCWTNTALNHIDSWRFTLSTYLYTCISGQKPYPETDREKRVEDYFDNNFIPLNLLIQVNEDLSQAINHNLSLTNKAHQSIKPQKQKSRVSSLASNILDTTKTGEANSLPIPLPLHSLTIQKASTQILLEQEHFKIKKTKELSKKRFFRKYKTLVAVVGVIVVFVGIFTVSIIQSNLSRPTTEGMTEAQVVQTFYNAVNTLDSMLLDSTGVSSAIGDYSTMVSTIFVSAKMREAYERVEPFLPPAQWIGTDDPTSLFVYGLSNVLIEQLSSTHETPQEGDTATFTVSFNTIVNQGLENYEISQSIDTLTLTYGRKHWQITELVSNTEQVPVDSATFIEDVNIVRELIKEDSSIQLHEQGILLSETLREKYFWLPSIQEVRASAELIPTYLLESKE